jgi:hypothetical protein
LPIFACAIISAHCGERSPADRAHFHPLDVALIGSQVAIGVLVWRDAQDLAG